LTQFALFQAPPMYKLSERLSYESLYAQAISDPELKRTRLELEQALSNASEERNVVYELFQDLDGFSLDDYKPFSDTSEGMNEIVRFVRAAVEDENKQFRHEDNDVYLVSSTDSGEQFRFTTDRDFSIDAENTELLGLDHPTIVQYMNQYRNLPEEQIGICVHSEDGRTGVLSVWYVTTQGERGEIRVESLRNDGDGSEATEFYRENREAMDEGSVVAWAERHNDDEISAIQHAMNLKLRDEAAFFAEYQNEPLPENIGEDEQLTVDDIVQKLNGHKLGEIPIGCNHLTMFIDVHGKLLYYVVVAWESNFTGYVVDYGAYPDQRRQYFTLRDARPTLLDIKRGAGLEGSIYAGLEALTEKNGSSPNLVGNFGWF